MARKEYQGKAVHTDSQFSCRYLTAFAALILKVIIHWIQNFLTDNFNATEANYLYLVYPVVGIFLTGLFVPLRGEGRHQSWCYQNPIRHLAAAGTHQTA